MKDYRRVFISTLIGSFLIWANLHLLSFGNSSTLWGLVFLGIWCVYILYLTWLQYRIRWTICFLLLGLLACAIEYIALKTCFPYWCFSYYHVLWPRLDNSFPYILFFIRPSIVFSLYHVSSYVTTFHWARIMLTVVFLLILDIFLDPSAVWLWWWSYDQRGPRFWVPLSNYLGWVYSWLLSVLCTFGIIHTRTTKVPLLACSGLWLLWFFAGLFFSLLRLWW